MPYDPAKHLIKVQGGREYLPVAQRLVWFREAHPDWGIQTEIVQLDLEQGFAVFRATITDQHGRVMSQATKVETVRGFADFTEKAETGSIGRALALVGFGTQFAPELEEGERMADAPGRRPGQDRGRPAGCTCLTPEHAPQNPKCALNRSHPARATREERRATTAAVAPRAHASAEAQRTASPGAVVLCERCGKAPLPDAYVSHARATGRPLVCDACDLEASEVGAGYEP